MFPVSVLSSGLLRRISGLIGECLRPVGVRDRNAVLDQDVSYDIVNRGAAKSLSSVISFQILECGGAQIYTPRRQTG